MSGRLATALFATALFMSAFLLFALEPMVAKDVLPKLGGTPMVWNTCIVFFQGTLLVGYLLAHVFGNGRSAARTSWLHPALLIGSLLTLPLTFARVPGVADHPAAWLLTELVRVAGLPVLALSMSAPALQAWFASTRLPDSDDPYFLYAASNAGSLLALLAYPTIIEPRLGLQPQGRLWAAGYVLLTAIVCSCIFVPRVHVTRDEPREAVDRPMVDRWARLRWVTLAFIPSSLMLGVTTYISTDVAAVPLIWVLPLALYLVTFVFAFSRVSATATAIAQRVLPPAVVVVVVLLPTGTGVTAVSILLHLLLFTAVAMMCHGRLAAERPPVARLTEFYVLLSLGGVAGGVFNTLIAPLVFTSVTEYPLVLACGCAVRALQPGGALVRPTVRDLLFAAGAGALLATTIGIPNLPHLGPRLQFVAASAVAFGVLSQSRRPVRFALMVGALLIASAIATPTFGTVLHAERTFFGSYHVGEKPAEGFRALYHGTTLHGMQWLNPLRQHEPLSYYHRSGPVGQAFERIARLREASDVAVVGLGAGSLAAYVREFQRWTFYEIDPAVERIARDPRYFTFLNTCGTRCQVVLGDARLSLARSSARYDGIVLDAFSSDAIPVHLLTREAFTLYLERLKPGGVLVFHVSNRYLRLAPVLARLAGDRGMTTFEELRTAAQASGTTDGEMNSDWVVASADPGALVALATDPRWTLISPPPGTPLWTDDFSNILAVLR